MKYASYLICCIRVGTRNRYATNAVHSSCGRVLPNVFILSSAMKVSPMPSGRKHYRASSVDGSVISCRNFIGHTACFVYIQLRPVPRPDDTKFGLASEDATWQAFFMLSTPIPGEKQIQVSSSVQFSLKYTVFSKVYREGRPYGRVMYRFRINNTLVCSITVTRMYAYYTIRHARDSGL